MAISKVTSIAAQATEMQGTEIKQRISVAVMKQALEQQEKQAEALIRMMRQTSAVVDGHVDIYA